MVKYLTASIAIRYALTTFTVMVLCIAGAGLSPATAADREERIVTTAVEDRTVISEAETGSFGLTLPGTLTDQPQVSLAVVPEEYLEATNITPLVNTTLSHAAVSSYETGNGTQTLIRIDSDKATKEYRFPLSLPEGVTAELIKGGTLLVKGADGEILGGYKTPWAVDANGNHVPTWFTLDGDTLIQTVDFTPETAFPVIADPNDFWGWTVCVATITGIIAGNVLAIKYVTKIGGIAKLAKKLLEAGSDTERWRVVGAIAGYITGADIIIKNCR